MKNAIIGIRSVWLFAIVAVVANLVTAQTVEKKTLTLKGAESVIAAAKAEAHAFTPGASAASGSTPPVSYFEKSKVDDAFSKGAILLDGSDGRNYMVHASRREKPGQAEIHTKDADVIYVLEGSAKFITGGEAVDAKTTAPDELRGTSIRNGETRQIAKGDVIVVPNGVPHQFLEVTNPFLYYVVKVR